MSVDMTVTEMWGSLTGFDEIAIESSWGADFASLAKDKPSMAARAMIFVHLRRQDQSDPAAKQAAMEMPNSAVDGYFAPESEDAMPDEPDSAAGKGDSSPVSEPAS